MRPPAQHPYRPPKAFLGPLLLACLLAAPGSALSQGSEAAELPVTRLVLFTSGVGYFEHSGTVSGDTSMQIALPEEAMDDLLQSLLLQDFGEGNIRPVRYPSRDPLGRILGSYSIDLSGNPTLAELLSQSRGELVEIETSETLTGRLVNVERVPVAEEEPVTYITLASRTGLVRVDLTEVRSVRFLDETVQRELESALATLARFSANDEQPLRLRFEGEGERLVSIGYVREMPVWKSSYRLLLQEDGGAQLQGWAILDNPTDMDLEETEVVFVAGRPVSFVSNLFEPVYVERERADSLARGQANLREADAFGQSSARRDMAAAMEALAPQAASTPADAGVEALAQGTATGATFQYRVEEPVTVGRHESAMIPIIVADVEATPLSVFDARTNSLHPMQGVRLQNDTGLHLAAGPATVFGEGGFTGNALIGDIVPGGSQLLTYAVDLGATVQASRESRPEEVVAVAIRNGVIETSQRQRIVTTYSVEVQDEDGRFLVIEHPRLDGFRIVSPSVAPADTSQAHRFGVKLGTDQTTPETDGELPVHRRCPEGDRCELRVVQERETSRTVTLTNLSSQQIVFYLENVSLSDEDRQAFDRILDLQQRLARLDGQISNLQQQIDSIFRDQQRIRQNMAQLQRDSTLYRRYLADLESQEDELNDLGGTLEDRRDEREQVQQRLDELLASL